MSTEPNKAAAGTAPKPKKKSKMMLIVVFLLIVLAGAGGFFGWKHFKAAKTAKADTTLHAAETDADEEASEDQEPKKGKKKKKKDADHSAEGGTISFEPFLVNLADKEASRYVKTSIRLLVADKETAETIAKGETLMPRMRDTILNLLSSKTAEEVTSNEGKEMLKKEILERVNEYLPAEGASEVFFTDFVVQF
jgi:flagellar protein FliL